MSKKQPVTESILAITDRKSGRLGDEESAFYEQTDPGVNDGLSEFFSKLLAESKTITITPEGDIVGSGIDRRNIIDLDAANLSDEQQRTILQMTQNWIQGKAVVFDVVDGNKLRYGPIIDGECTEDLNQAKLAPVKAIGFEP